MLLYAPRFTPIRDQRRQGRQGSLHTPSIAAVFKLNMARPRNSSDGPDQQFKRKPYTALPLTCDAFQEPSVAPQKG